MHVLESLASLASWRNSLQGETLVFVPTMGALHAGHLSLIEKAKTLGQRVIVSIYVNPLQFGPNEDFDRYPRPKEKDLQLCASHGVDAVFYPKTEELYPNGQQFQTQIIPPIQLMQHFCGASRPGHFSGVATIVLKLLNLVQPNIAVFGQKDAQQLAIIRRVVADLNVPVEIIGANTVREADGLAMSSRNQYLSGEHRLQARLLSRLIKTIQDMVAQGYSDTQTVLTLAQDQVISSDLYPDFQLEYLAAVDDATFAPTETLTPEARILVAAKVGAVRLIDNALVSDPIELIPTLPGLTQTH